MDLTPGREIVARHWRLIAIVALACSVIAFGASFLWAPKYSATAHVLVVAREARFLNAQGQQQPYDPTLVASLDETYSQFLKSRGLAEKVVDDLNLDNRKVDSSFFGQVRSGLKRGERVALAIVIHGYYAEPNAHEGDVEQVQQNIIATPIKDSFVLEIKATADDPKLASAIANAAVDELINFVRDRDQQNASVYVTFLKGEVDRLSSEVAQATEDIRKFKEDNKLTDIQTQLVLTAESDRSLSDQLRTNEINLAAARAEYNALESSLDSIASTDSSTSTIQTGRSTTTLTNSSANVVYQTLAAQAASKRAEIASLQSQHDTITALLQPAASLLPAQEAELYQLQLKQSSAEGAYTAVQQAYENQLLTSQSTPQELSVVDSATPPIYPDSPLRYLYALLGLLFGAAGGAGLGYYRDRNKKPVRLLKDLGGRSDRRSHPTADGTQAMGDDFDDFPTDEEFKRLAMRRQFEEFLAR